MNFSLYQGKLTFTLIQGFFESAVLSKTTAAATAFDVNPSIEAVSLEVGGWGDEVDDENDEEFHDTKEVGEVT